MDMRRHLKRWLNHGDLRQMGGSYEGIISEVVEEEVRNRYTAKREKHPVIEFTDGRRIVPNIGMRRVLIESFGAETDAWVERKIRIFLRPMARRNATGELRSEKAVECLDQQATEPPPSTALKELAAADISWDQGR